jgi:hypothetical protein
MENKKRESGKSTKPTPTKEQVQSKIITNIKLLYKTEKGKKYIAHLISAFLTDTQPKPVTEKEQGMKLRCAITSFQILTEREVMGDINDARLALSSIKSSKTLSNMTLACLKEFVAQEMLKENKHIKLCLNHSKKQTPSISVNEPKNIDVKTIKPQQPYNNIVGKFEGKKEQIISGGNEFKRATFSLADNDVLSALQKQLSKNE